MNSLDKNSQTAGQLTTGKTTKLGLDYNVAAALCYMPLPLVGVGFSILWLSTEPRENAAVRFHAVQSLILSGSALVAGMVISNTLTFLTLSLFGMLGYWALQAFCTIAGIAFLVVSLICMISAFKGETRQIPVIGTYAQKYSQ